MNNLYQLCSVQLKKAFVAHVPSAKYNYPSIT